MTPLKRRVVSAMAALKDVVILPKSHCDALIDHLSCLPGILQNQEEYPQRIRGGGAYQ
jgi:hypothetical protein